MLSILPDIYLPDKLHIFLMSHPSATPESRRGGPYRNRFNLTYHILEIYSGKVLSDFCMGLHNVEDDFLLISVAFR